MTWWAKPPGTGETLSWNSDVFVTPCFLSWRLSVLSKLRCHAIRRRGWWWGKPGAPPFCLREMCCSASASLDADVCSVWVRKLTKKPDTWLPSSHQDVFMITNNVENQPCRRDPVFLGELCCLPELPAGSSVWSELFFSFRFASWNFFWVMEDATAWHCIFCAVTCGILTSLDVFNFLFGFQSAKVNGVSSALLLCLQRASSGSAEAGEEGGWMCWFGSPCARVAINKS